MAEDFERIMLLNRIASQSVTTAPEPHRPVTHGLEELLRILDRRRSKGDCIEFIGSEDHEDDGERKALGWGHHFIRLRGLRFDEVGSNRYAILLFEYVDQNSRTFPVVDIENFRGRELSGEAEERGATAAHVVAKLPRADGYDDGSYRCVVEYAPPITRAMIERFLSRQLRRVASSEEWFFDVVTKGKKGKNVEKQYRYHPKLQLLSDFGRRLSASTNKTLTHAVFTKRQTRQSTSKETDVNHQDFVADVEVRVSAKQAPDDPIEKAKFFSAIRAFYESLNYETRYYFRHARGGTISGEVNKAVESAADVMMCQREIIVLQHQRKVWTATIDQRLVDKMQELLNKDELWQAAEGSRT